MFVAIIVNEALRESELRNLPFTHVIREAMSAWMVQAFKTGYLLRKQETDWSNSANLISAGPESMPPVIITIIMIKS